MTAVDKFPRLSSLAGTADFATVESLGPQVKQPLSIQADQIIDIFSDVPQGLGEVVSQIMRPQVFAER